MNSRELSKAAEDIRTLLAEYNSFLSYLVQLSKRIDYYAQLPKSIATLRIDGANQSSWQELKNQLKRQTDESVSDIRKFPPHKFAVTASNLAIRLAQIPILTEQTTFKELTDITLPRLSELHTNAYSDREPGEVYNFLLLCQRLTTQFSILEAFRNEFSKLAGGREDASKDTSEYLELFLNEEEYSVNSLAILLLFIEKLYIFVHQIEYPDEPVVPLQYLKIETGSKWLKFFGKKEIILVLGILIGDCSDAIKTLATAPSPSEAQRAIENMEAMSKYMDLCEKAKKLGYSAEDMETFRQAYLGSMFKLSSGCKDLELNGKTIISGNETGGRIPGISFAASSALEIEE